MKTTNTPLRRGLLAAAIAITLAACSDNSESSTTAVADDGPSAEVTSFCASTTALAGQIAALLADPAGGDLAALNAQAQAISITAKALVATHQTEAATISACVSTVTAAINGTGPVGGSVTTLAGEPGGGGASTNPDVQAFCASADALAAQLSAVIADPTKAGELAALSAQVQTLATQAAALITASPADAQAVTDCAQKMADALLPGGGVPPPATVALDTTVVPDVTVAPVTTAAGGATSSNPDVIAYCASADAIAAQLAAVMADPTKAGDLVALSAQVQDLIASSVALSSTDPADTAAVQACTDRITAALTPSG